MGWRTTAGLTTLVAALAMPATAEEVKEEAKVAAARPSYSTIDQQISSTPLKQPDQALYDAIGRLDPKRAEEMNEEKRYSDVPPLVEKDLWQIREYDLNDVAPSLQAKVAWAANELGLSYGKLKHYDVSLVWLKFSDDLNPIDGSENLPGRENPRVVKLNLSVAALNTRNFQLAYEAASMYMNLEGQNAFGAQIAEIVIAKSSQALNGQ